MSLIAASGDLPEALSSVYGEQESQVRIVVKGNSLRVIGAQGLTLEIFSVTGARVKAVKIGTNDETVNPGVGRGCFIVKIGDVVRKVNLL